MRREETTYAKERHRARRERESMEGRERKVRRREIKIGEGDVKEWGYAWLGEDEEWETVPYFFDHLWYIDCPMHVAMDRCAWKTNAI